MSARRTAAIGALLLGFGGLALAVVVAVQEFPRGLIALACVALAFRCGLVRRPATRRGPRRRLSVGALGLGAAILLAGDRLLEELLVVTALVLSCACARGVRRPRPPATGAGASAAGVVLQPQVRRRQGRAVLAGGRSPGAGSSRSS